MQNKCMLIDNANFPYDLILGRDTLKNAEINLNTCKLILGNVEIPFEDKYRCTTQDIIACDCFVSDLLLAKSKQRKKS